MNFNNAPLVISLGEGLDIRPNALEVPIPRRRVVSDPCLPERLPTSGFIQREAEELAPRATLRQLRRSPSPTEENETPTSADSKHTRRPSTSSATSSSSIKSAVRSFLKSPPTSRTPADWKAPEAYQVFRAIEERDVMFLMQVRDNAFHLLLRNSGNATPLVHAMRLGYKDVAIILLGAFSRWVNHLEDEDIEKQHIQTYLKALRTNLKLAIDEGLASSQSDLIASFMQTLIMSEGNKWVLSQVSAISRALNVGMEATPVRMAGDAVRSFATKRLGKAELIASFEDYVANATGDLLMMSAWSSVLQSVQGDMIPTYYFARDDRVYKAFVDRLDQHKTEIQRKCSRRLKWQIRVLRTCLEGRSVTYRRKVELLTGELDESDVV
ncbi:hypothetical protein BDQ12DRAFT_675282 [Crucibulum laeve]|uniref:Uncharacterized protein n=1 Tax=Crucibulum laeve TaxID=68775 RepID=A0A5C3MI63_9AGAR|nr:hypothetical protein BDQ12DRAFT_675282 [Crucibulum laeve]